MTWADVRAIKEAVLEAGFEIYRSTPTEISIAERIRLHLMDSGVRIEVGDHVRVLFVARSQRSDFPSVSPEQLFAKVRDSVGVQAGSRGYVEIEAKTTEVHDPVDRSKILDVWHEVTYGRGVESTAELVEELRFCVPLEKYVTASPL